MDEREELMAAENRNAATRDLFDEAPEPADVFHTSTSRLGQAKNPMLWGD